MDSQSNSMTTPQPLFQETSDAFVETPSNNSTYVLYGFILLAVIVLVAHYAGFNVFGYLGNATDAIGDTVFPFWERILKSWAAFVEMIGGGSVAESKELGKTAAQGVKKTAQAVEKGADELDKTLDGEDSDPEDEEEEVNANIPESSVNGGKKSKNGETPITKASDVDEEDVDDLDIQIEKSELKKAIKKSKHTTDKDREKVDDIKPNDVFTGPPRARPGNNKSGWCYIGTYSGYRSCSRVGEADKCMSGDIFPTHDVCVNPNLRP